MNWGPRDEDRVNVIVSRILLTTSKTTISVGLAMPIHIAKSLKNNSSRSPPIELWLYL